MDYYYSHEHVHERVEEDGEVHVARVAAAREDEPDHDGDGGVVEEVQEGDLAEGVAQDEEPGVAELPVLLGVEHPEGEREVAAQRGLVLGVADELGRGVGQDFVLEDALWD